uniref:Glycosyl transferase n=1 Tax=Thermosporothrix sp. COM3 TaxID=2490863 RepID=A0A455SKV4_9CHLR|nr:glycosyl transferase [Thermosporothrix sp. COM3]
MAINEQTRTAVQYQQQVTPVHPTFSVVAPVFNEEETLPVFYTQITRVMEEVGEPFELVFVNDGSRDRSYQVLRELHQQDKRVHVLDFSRNFGHQMAISAGLEYAHGEAVIIIDSDLQDPPQVIPRLIERWRNGAEVVYAQRTTRKGETPVKLLTASLFYRVLALLTDVSIPRDTGDFRLLDRRVVRQLVSMREHHRFMRGLSAWVGFRQEAVLYERKERFAGSSHYSMRKMLRLSFDAITSFSYVPLRLASVIGGIVLLLGLLGLMGIALFYLFTHSFGLLEMALAATTFLAGLQMLFLGLIGEYLGRMYDELRGRPLYIVRETLFPDVD